MDAHIQNTLRSSSKRRRVIVQKEKEISGPTYGSDEYHWGGQVAIWLPRWLTITLIRTEFFQFSKLFNALIWSIIESHLWSLL